MGEILSKDTLNLLRNAEVQQGIRKLVESEHAPPSVPVEIRSAEGVTATLILRIASS
jgi:hypothetical protein